MSALNGPDVATDTTMADAPTMLRTCAKCGSPQSCAEFDGCRRATSRCATCRAGVAAADKLRSARRHPTRAKSLPNIGHIRFLQVIYPDIERPHTRGDCQICSTCQEWRDGVLLLPACAQIAEGLLACGHTPNEAVAHSRPCLFAGCSAHLYLDVSPRTGALKLNFPDLDVDQMAVSCVLDVADEGGTSLERVGRAMNIVRERVRQIEVSASEHMRGAAHSENNQQQ